MRPPTTTLTERLQNDTNAALRAGDKARLSILRLTMAAGKSNMGKVSGLVKTRLIGQ